MDDKTETAAAEAPPARSDAVSIRMKQTAKVDGVWRQKGEVVETTPRIGSHLIRAKKAVPADMAEPAENRAVAAAEAKRETKPKKAPPPTVGDSGAVH